MRRADKSRAAKADGVFAPRRDYPIYRVEGDDRDAAGKRTGMQITAPEMASARVVLATERASGLDDLIDVPGLMAAIRGYALAVVDGDLARSEAMLMSQATALQSLFVRLVERELAQNALPQYEAHMRLALKAQSQCRATLQALTELKHGPAVFARQANVSSGGPIQVNNGIACTRDTEIAPNQLSGAQHELPANRGATAGAIAGDSPMEALAAIDGADKHRRKAANRETRIQGSGAAKVSSSGKPIEGAKPMSLEAKRR